LTAVVIPAYLTLREHEVLLILRSVVKMPGDVVSCLLSEFHWPKVGFPEICLNFAAGPCYAGITGPNGKLYTSRCGNALSHQRFNRLRGFLLVFALGVGALQTAPALSHFSTM
jgi:hypothetical protein